jgi:hypothetical protein
MNLSDATAVYVGTTEAKAVYYGPQLLWNVPGWEPLPSSALFTGLAAGDEFGRSVAINLNGDRVIVGSPAHNRFLTDVGLASFFEFSSGEWNRIDFKNTTNQSRFGISVAMNSTGDIVAVAGYTAAAVFTRTVSGFTRLGSNISLSNPAPNQGANAKISLSDAGDVFAVSQMGADYSGTTRIFEWNGTAWVQRGATIGSEVSGDRSGDSISLNSSGTRIAIGAIRSATNGSFSGHARVFEWSGSAWNQVGASILGVAAEDRAGAAVSLNSSGTRIAIGAPRHNTPTSSAGHVRVFEDIDGAWVQMGQSINGEATNDFSGGSVSLNASGDLVAIGAERNTNDAGHVRIYKWTGLEWEQQGADIDGDAAGDRFGFDVALNSSGTILIAGAPLNDTSGSNAGAAKVLSTS